MPLRLFAIAAALPRCPKTPSCTADEGRNVFISTTNLNYPLRMGSKKLAVYLCSPLTSPSQRLTGKFTDPRAYINTKTRNQTGMAGVV